MHSNDNVSLNAPLQKQSALKEQISNSRGSAYDAENSKRISFKIQYSSELGAEPAEVAQKYHFLMERPDSHSFMRSVSSSSSQARDSFKSGTRLSINKRPEQSQQLQQRISTGNKQPHRATQRSISSAHNSTHDEVMLEAREGLLYPGQLHSCDSQQKPSDNLNINSSQTNITYVNASSQNLNVGGRDLSAAGQGEYCEVDEIDYNRCFPWIRVVVRLLGSVSFQCEHQRKPGKMSESNETYEGMCQGDCYLKQFKASHSLIEAVLRMYETAHGADGSEKEQEAKAANKPNSGSSSLKTKKDKPANVRDIKVNSFNF